MLGYLWLIIDLAIFALVLYWIYSDLQGRGTEEKTLWVWMILTFVGFLFLGLIGLAMTVLFYYFLQIR